MANMFVLLYIRQQIFVYSRMTQSDIERLYAIIGHRIRDLRDKASLTQASLGERVGLSRASIVNIEKGRQHPPIHVLWDIAVVLEVEVPDLLPRLPDFEKELSEFQLSPEFMEMIEKAAAGNKVTLRNLAEFIGSSKKDIASDGTQNKT